MEPTNEQFSLNMIYVYIIYDIMSLDLIRGDTRWYFVMYVRAAQQHADIEPGLLSPVQVVGGHRILTHYSLHNINIYFFIQNKGNGV